MHYIVTEQGILLFTEDEEADAVAKILDRKGSVGCAFGSIVEIPPIPDAEAVAEVERVAAKLREELKAIGHRGSGAVGGAEVEDVVSEQYK